MSYLKKISVTLLFPLMTYFSPAALSTSFAQPGTPPATLDAAARSEIIHDLVVGLQEQYVDEEVGKHIGVAVMAANKAGAYDKLTNPAQFAEVVTRDLRKLNGDLHLSLSVAHHGQQGGPVMKREAEGAGVSDEEKAAMAAATAESRRQNYGLGRAEILDGNIGYLEIRGFESGEGVEEAVANALRFLQYTDAIIIDLRRNHGGDGEMSNLVYSHFFSDKPVATINFVSRSSKVPESMFTMDKVPGPRRPEVPLYVLTSQDTASAAEEFSFVLQNHHRATLIGSRTAGAGHMVTSVPIAHGFALGVSITRVTDPVSGKEWEHTGVLPDMAVRPEQALTVAHAEAVRHALAGTSDATISQQLTKLLVTLDARKQPQSEDAATLAGYVGIYQGRAITVNGGKINYSRVGGLPEELTYLGNRSYAIRSSQLSFEKSGGKLVLNIVSADGAKVRLERD